MIRSTIIIGICLLLFAALSAFRDHAFNYEEAFEDIIIHGDNTWTLRTVMRFPVSTVGNYRDVSMKKDRFAYIGQTRFRDMSDIVDHNILQYYYSDLPGFKSFESRDSIADSSIFLINEVHSESISSIALYHNRYWALKQTSMPDTTSNTVDTSDFAKKFVKLDRLTFNLYEFTAPYKIWVSNESPLLISIQMRSPTKSELQIKDTTKDSLAQMFDEVSKKYKESLKRYNPRLKLWVRFFGKNLAYTSNNTTLYKTNEYVKWQIPVSQIFISSTRDTSINFKIFAK